MNTNCLKVVDTRRKAKTGVGNKARLLTNEEWTAIHNWAKQAVGKQTIDEVERLADEAVKQLLWPSTSKKRYRMALAVLCQGYLACFAKKGPKTGRSDKLNRLLATVVPRGRDQTPVGCWKEVQTATWWLKVLCAGDATKKSKPRLKEALNSCGVLQSAADKPSGSLSALFEPLVSGNPSVPTMLRHFTTG